MLHFAREFLFTCNVHIAYLSLAGAATSISFVATKFWPPPKKVNFVATKLCLLRQTVCCYKLIFSRHTIYVATIICRSKHNFVATSLLLSWQYTAFVTTKVCLSRQTFWAHKRFCAHKRFVATNTCLLQQINYFSDKHFVPTILSRQTRQEYFRRYKKRVLPRQESYLWQLPPMISTDISNTRMYVEGRNADFVKKLSYSGLQKPGGEKSSAADI